MPIVLLQRFRKCTSEQGLADNSVIEIMTLLHNVFSLVSENDLRGLDYSELPQTKVAAANTKCFLCP